MKKLGLNKKWTEGQKEQNECAGIKIRDKIEREEGVFSFRTFFLSIYYINTCLHMEAKVITQNFSLMNLSFTK